MVHNETKATSTDTTEEPKKKKCKAKLRMSCMGFFQNRQLFFFFSTKAFLGNALALCALR